MTELDKYISGSRRFPMKKTGLSVDDFEVQSWKMKAENIKYNCSFCNCEITHNDFFTTHTEKDYTVQRNGINGAKQVSEVLGFICRACYDEISEYDNLYYG